VRVEQYSNLTIGREYSIYSDRHKLGALKASDFAFFAATWWPKARYEELRVMLYLTIWLFTWDDEIDEPTGSYTDDLEGAERYRTQTIDFVLDCIGCGDSAVPEPTNRIIGSFRDIGEPLASAYTLSMVAGSHLPCVRPMLTTCRSTQSLPRRDNQVLGALQARTRNSPEQQDTKCGRVLALSHGH
jgi:hypothetical protein